VTTQNYREAVWRADANLKWGGPAPEVVAARGEAEGAVKEILNVYATGTKETATGIAMFRLEKSADKCLLQEIRETSPLF